MSEERGTLTGVTGSSVLLIAFGCLLGLYCLLFSLALRSPMGGNHDRIRIAALAVVFGALSFLCLKAGFALRRSRRWGAYTAAGFGFLLIIFGIKALHDAFDPHAAPSIEGGNMVYGTMIAIPCIAVGLWWCIYLNLPHVRRHLLNSIVAEAPNGA